jgi:hypothetical protein
MVYLDLDELPMLTGRRGLLSTRQIAIRSFIRGDHLFEPSLSLAYEVRDIIRRETGQVSVGPIRLLTQLRHFGYYMSPLNLFYVHDANDERVEFIVAEVNNTPWNERHCYVLWDGNRCGRRDLQFNHPKTFHVSPFMDMDLEYRWRLTNPGESLAIRLSNLCDQRPVFHAAMTLSRRELNRPNLRTMSLRYPWMTVQIVTAIYYQALKLWWKKCPFYTHPNKRIPMPVQSARLSSIPPSRSSLDVGGMISPSTTRKAD